MQLSVRINVIGLRGLFDMVSISYVNNIIIDAFTYVFVTGTSCTILDEYYF